MVTLASRSRREASAVSSWKWVANSARQRLTSCRCSTLAQAIDSPSKVAVPRPISSRMTSARGPAWLRMAAVSTISTMKVERPRARSSAAPTRLNSRSTMPIWADSAGTKEPICAMMAISAFWRRKVDFPAMFGPVTSQMERLSSPDRSQSLGTNACSPARASAISTTGWRPATISNLRESSTFGRT
jgi:hypothetical protein